MPQAAQDEASTLRRLAARSSRVGTVGSSRRASQLAKIASQRSLRVGKHARNSSRRQIDSRTRVTSRSSLPCSSRVVCSSSERCASQLSALRLARARRRRRRACPRGRPLGVLRRSPRVPQLRRLCRWRRSRRCAPTRPGKSSIRRADLGLPLQADSAISKDPRRPRSSSAMRRTRPRERSTR